MILFKLWIAPGEIGENGPHAPTSVALAKRCESEKRMNTSAVAACVKASLSHTRNAIDLLN